MTINLLNDRPTPPDMNVSPFRNAFYWHLQKVRDADPTLNSRQVRVELEKQIRQNYLDPLLSCLLDLVPTIPQKVPKLSMKAPSRDSLMLLRYPYLFRNICMLCCHGSRDREIVTYLKQHYPKAAVSPLIVQNLLYFFFYIPDPKKTSQKDFIALIHYLNPSKRPFFKLLNGLLMGMVSEPVFKYLTGQPIGTAISANQVKFCLTLASEGLPGLIHQGEIAQAQARVNLINDLIPINEYFETVSDRVDSRSELESKDPKTPGLSSHEAKISPVVPKRTA